MTVEHVDVDRYLERIGFDRPVAIDHATLAGLQRAHLTAVPFENLDIHAGIPVRTDLAWSLSKILDQGRGGWCFELNGAFAALLEALGFEVLRLGAAVLLEGPATVIDHLTIEVLLDEPWLVDVGFGASFFLPLGLRRPGPQDGGSAEFEFLASPQGTTLAELDDGIPVAQYRFKRVGHRLVDFDPASEALQSDPTAHWRTKPFATRLLDGGPDRVTLLHDRLKLQRGGVTTEEPVEPSGWSDMLMTWFAMSPPTDGPSIPGKTWPDRGLN